MMMVMMSSFNLLVCIIGVIHLRACYASSNNSSDAEEAEMNEIMESQSQDDLSSLRLAQIIWRGGLHAMEPGNPYKKLKIPFPESVGHLTAKGKKQMYQVGKYLRVRYGPLLNYSYDAVQVRLVAGDKNRTVDSALMLAAGMFPPTESYEIWNPNILWQPVPVHIDERLSDTGGATLVLKEECPNLSYVKESEHYKSLEKKFSSLIDYLCTAAETKKNNFFYGFVVASSMYILSHYNGTTPPWANDTIVDESIRFYWETEEFLSTYADVVKLSAGWIMDLMINEMRDKANKYTDRKFYGYSSHDDSMHALMKLVNPNAHLLDWPPYGGFAAIELHLFEQSSNSTNSGDDYIVKVKYWYAASKKPIDLAIENCSDPCTLTKFADRSSNFISRDWGADCGIGRTVKLDKYGTASTARLLMVICIVLVVLFVISFSFCIWTKYQLIRTESDKSSLTFSNTYGSADR